MMFQAHHLFPSEIATRGDEEANGAKDLLQSIGFDLEARANKKLLFFREEDRNSALGTDAQIQEAFTDAGIGFNVHRGGHSPYNDFGIRALYDLALDADAENWDAAAKERAVFDFLPVFRRHDTNLGGRARARVLGRVCRRRRAKVRQPFVFR